MGDFWAYVTVGYRSLWIVNILSLAEIKREYEVRLDSGAMNNFKVAKNDKRVFNQSSNKLYIFDVNKKKKT